MECYRKALGLDQSLGLNEAVAGGQSKGNLLTRTVKGVLPTLCYLCAIDIEGFTEAIPTN